MTRSSFQTRTRKLCHETKVYKVVRTKEIDADVNARRLCHETKVYKGRKKSWKEYILRLDKQGCV